MKPRTILLTAVTLLTGPSLGAQNAASTLTELARRAAAIGVCQIAAREDRGPTTRVTVLVRSWLVGDGPSRVSLTEPAGPSCGRALSGLAVGAGYLVFFDRVTPDARLSTSDSRSIVGVAPGLAEHVRALRLARPDQLPSLLGRALGDRNPRIRADAALALQCAPAVEAAAPELRRQIVDALAIAFADGDLASASLAVAAARCGATEALDVLVPGFLAGRRPELDRLLIACIERFPSDDIAVRVGARLRAQPVDASRVLTLATGLDDRAGIPILATLMVGSDRPMRVDAARELLDRGVPRETLKAIGARPEDLALGADTGPTPINFHSINPRRTR